jgi:ABC-2 type transport system permease protein
VIRNAPVQQGIEYRYENTNFVLNLIDSLTPHRDYIDIRSRRQRYMTLRHVEDTIREATGESDARLQQYEIDFQTRIQGSQAEARAQVEDLQRDVERMVEARANGEEVDVVALDARQKLLEQVVRTENEKLQRIAEEMINERNEMIRSTRLGAELEIQEIQRRYKLAAVLIPPVPPLLLGLIVFTRRRLREREGISKARRLR